MKFSTVLLKIEEPPQLNRLGLLVKKALVLLALVVIVGCETVPVDEAVGVPGAVADQALVDALQQRNRWSMRASLGINAEATSNSSAQNVSASMAWAEQPEKLDVVLSGPFGVGRVILSADPVQATLRRGRSTFVDRDPSILVQRALNLVVPVPLDELSFWMRGLPGSGANLVYDQFGRLQSLSYIDGSGVAWNAVIQRYRQADGLSVPALITAVGGPYKVRLAIKDWLFDSINSDEKPAENDLNGRLSIPGRSS